MRIHYLQHVEFEGPAAILQWANAARHSVSSTLLYQGQPLPSVDAFDMLVVMGGPMSVNEEDQYPWLLPEKTLVRAAIDRGCVVLGVCLGAQLIANAMGARVYRATEKEIGWFPVRRVTANGLGAAFPETFTPLHWHGETFDLPQGAVRLAQTDAVPNQAFQLGRRTLGLQFHLEATPQSVAAIVRHAAHEIGPGRFQQPPAAILDCQPHLAAIQPLFFDLLDQLTK